MCVNADPQKTDQAPDDYPITWLPVDMVASLNYKDDGHTHLKNLVRKHVF